MGARRWARSHLWLPAGGATAHGGSPTSCSSGGAGSSPTLTLTPEARTTRRRALSSPSHDRRRVGDGRLFAARRKRGAAERLLLRPGATRPSYARRPWCRPRSPPASRASTSARAARCERGTLSSLRITLGTCRIETEVERRAAPRLARRGAVAPGPPAAAAGAAPRGRRLGGGARRAHARARAAARSALLGRWEAPPAWRSRCGGFSENKSARRHRWASSWKFVRTRASPALTCVWAPSSAATSRTPRRLRARRGWRASAPRTLCAAADAGSPSS